jgi:CysZ protein
MSQLTDVPHFLQRGTHLALSRTLRPWVIVPLLFNILLFGFLYWLSGHYVNLWITHLLGGLHFSGIWSFLNSVVPYLQGALELLAWVLLLVTFSSFFTMAVQLVAAPFMGLLAEKVNHATSPSPLPQEGLVSMIMRTLTRTLKMLWYWLWRFVLIGMLVLILYLIPGLNLVASAVYFLFNGWILGMQYIDYGADCRQTSVREMRQRIMTKRWLVLGFGCVMLALTMLPLVNLVIIPIGVITGTLIWNERLAVGIHE